MLTTKRVVFLFSLLYTCHTIAAETTPEQQDKPKFEIPKKGEPCVLPPFSSEMPNELCTILREMIAGRVANNTLLLYGAIGGGKTKIAKAIGSLSNSAVIYVKSPDFTTNLGAQQLSVLLENGKKIQQKTGKRVVFIFDALDSIAYKIPYGDEKYNMNTVNIQNAFRLYLDAVQENSNLFIIGVTDEIKNFDPKIIRRFPTRVCIPHASIEDRKRIFQYHLESKRNQLCIQHDGPLFTEEEIEKFANAAHGLQASSIESVISLAIREFNDEENPTKFTASYILNNIAKIKS